jgi:tetratricopeptide (TPR) repeat protein
MRNIFYLFCSILICYSCNRDAKNKTTKTSSLTTNYSCSVPEVSDKNWYSSGKKAPLFRGLDGFNFLISTKNTEVQKYFNQGLMLSFGFNHAEAARSFFEITRQEPQCAMGWWGYAYVLGPNYNAGMEKDNFIRAFEAVKKAKIYSASCSEKEKDLINALTHRYSKDTTIVRSVLDSSYATAMRKVYKKYPKDVMIGVLFAESLMDQHPWDLWNKNGKPQPWTPEIITVLKECLIIEPRHAGANHLYIHAEEMSQHPENAKISADLLCNLVPGSGHLVHMPSHIYIRTGRYHDGVLANQKAVEIDSLYIDACHAQGAYPLAYYPHNYHFLSACATLSGESKLALKGALATANHAHKKIITQSCLGHFTTLLLFPWYVEVKLGLWKEILNTPSPEKELKYPSVIWHYAQGMAMLSKNQTVQARKHLASMRKIMTDPKIKDLTIWGINSVFDLCEIASKTLEGEIYAREKKYNQAILLLKEAVAKEDALNYNEPPDWFFSVRHHLGAVLISAGKYKDAVKIYEDDLKNFPNNGWALKGLIIAFEKLDDKKKSKEATIRFNNVWKYADIEITSSRIL